MLYAVKSKDMWLRYGIVIGVLCLCSKSVQSAPESPVNSVEEDEDAYYPSGNWSDTFDWWLLKKFSSPVYGNVMISPIALKLVLALLYEGSGGKTEKEFQMHLQFDVNKTVVRQKFLDIIQALEPGESQLFTLDLATRIFLDSRLTAQQNFAAKVSHNYRADIKSTNFSHPEDASQLINSWVKEQTHGRVTQLVTPGELEDTIMLICNALYFKGSWRHQFSKSLTRSGGFYISPTEIVEVPLMETTDTFYFFESQDLDAKIIRLPYKGKKYALFVVLPNSKGGLPDLINKVNLQLLKQQLTFMDPVLVELTLPKFKFNFEASYSNILQDLGLKQMFQNTASFPGIARGIPHLLRMLVVSEILQKTGIDLDEEGSTLVSATEVQVGNKFGDVEGVFNATHPFLFFIEEQTQGSIVFIGKLENPLEANPLPLPLPTRLSTSASTNDKEETTGKKTKK